MADNLLLCTVGLPRSGKTARARALSKDHNIPIVNPDSIRLALHGQRFAADAERFVWATAHTMVRALFLAGHAVVLVDATNTTRKRRDEWKSPYWKTAFLLADAPKEECLLRAGDDAEIRPVIERMAAQWEPLGSDEILVESLGATGLFPQGKCSEDDEGAIRLAVAADKRSGLVRVKFGKPVAWLGLPQAEAYALAETIRFHAAKLT